MSDTWERHAVDMLREGRLLADPRTAQIVARCAAQGFHDAGRYGTRLDGQGHGRGRPSAGPATRPTAAECSPTSTRARRCGEHSSNA